MFYVFVRALASRAYIREPPHLPMHSMSHHDIDQRNDPCMRRRKPFFGPADLAISM